MKKLLGLCGAVLMLAGCGTSPEPDYYMLTPVGGAVAPDLAVALQIDRPVLPDYLDRPSIVYQRGVTGIEFDEMNRWAAPLDTMFEDVLTENLRQRMPNSTITKEADDLPTRPAIVVEPEIEIFNETDEGATLRAHILVDNKNQCGVKMPLAIPFNASVPTHDVLMGQSQLIGMMADQIVAALHANQNALCEEPNLQK